MTRTSPSGLCATGFPRTLLTAPGDVTCFDKVDDRFISDCEAARIDNEAYDKAAKEEADRADKVAAEEADQRDKAAKEAANREKEEADRRNKTVKENADRVEKEKKELWAKEKKKQVELGISMGTLAGVVLLVIMTMAIKSHCQDRREAERAEAVRRIEVMIELEAAGSRVQA
jgi:hypothetical protein